MQITKDPLDRVFFYAYSAVYWQVKAHPGAFPIATACSIGAAFKRCRAGARDDDLDLITLYPDWVMEHIPGPQAHRTPTSTVLDTAFTPSPWWSG